MTLFFSLARRKFKLTGLTQRRTQESRTFCSKGWEIKDCGFSKSRLSQIILDFATVAYKQSGSNGHNKGQHTDGKERKNARQERKKATMGDLGVIRRGITDDM